MAKKRKTGDRRTVQTTRSTTRHQRKNQTTSNRRIKRDIFLHQQRTPSPLTQRLHRRGIKKAVVTGTTHPKQQVQKTSVKRGTLRLTMLKPDCMRRKKYKKQMLKSIAAQVKKSGGNMSAWRKLRATRRTITYRC